MKIRIGTRGSMLALAQCDWVKGKILEYHPRLEVEKVRIKTKGDKILDAPLSKIGGKGLFVKEIEEALLSGRVDLAVHSMKDVPAELPEGLILTAFPHREDPHDVLISAGDVPLEELPQGIGAGPTLQAGSGDRSPSRKCGHKAEEAPEGRFPCHHPGSSRNREAGHERAYQPGHPQGKGPPGHRTGGLGNRSERRQQEYH